MTIMLKPHGKPYTAVYWVVLMQAVTSQRDFVASGNAAGHASELAIGVPPCTRRPFKIGCVREP